jgi:CDP-diacylglycerol---glycerol-3-phosphate 3-phosphatidyltransferase
MTVDLPHRTPQQVQDQLDLELKDQARDQLHDHAIDQAHDHDLQFNNVPNQLTMLRIACVPLVVGLLFIQTPLGDFFAAVTFAVAAITDYFDGYIARKRKIVTVYGKLMDPLADKFLVVCSLIMLQYLGRIHPIVVMILVSRELGITGLRALASAEGVIISASGGGKWKAAIQMVAIPFLMLRQGLFEIPVFYLGMGMLYVSIAMSIWSAKDYVVDFIKALREQRKQKAHLRKTARAARHAARAARFEMKARRKAEKSDTKS